MSMLRNRVRRSRSRGIATVELIVVTPILLLIMAAIAEFGWAFHQYKTVTRAVRDGVRHAAGEALGSGIGIAIIDSTLAQETRNLVVYGNVVGTGTPLLPNWSTADVTVATIDSQRVRVEAAYQYLPVFARLPFFNGTPDNLAFRMHSSNVMRAL